MAPVTPRPQALSFTHKSACKQDEQVLTFAHPVYMAADWGSRTTLQIGRVRSLRKQILVMPACRSG